MTVSAPFMTLLQSAFHSKFEYIFKQNLLIMKTLFLNNPLFMGILTLLLITMVSWFVYHIISIKGNPDLLKSKLKSTTSIGLFALIVGVFHQLISWYSMIAAIEEAADITPGMVISAIKISMVPLIYGVAIYLLSLVLWAASGIIFRDKPSN